MLNPLNDYNCFDKLNLKGRKMRVYTKKFATITILSLLAFVMASNVCSAQDWSRSGKTEIFGVLEMLDTPVGDLDFYGIGLGYNLNDNFNLNTTFTFEEDVNWWNVNLDYNILPDRLTPLVQGGIGLLFNGGSEFTYSLGVGGRYDITDNIFVKAMYRITWVDSDDVDGIYLGIGYMF